MRIGHATDRDALTGCTVIRFDHPALTAVEVRGAAPGTRELDLLAPGRTVQRADAIVLSGGSAFGLAAAEGVVAALRASGRGFATPAGPVPIVPAAVLFDLARGEAIAPDADDGEAAWRAATAISDAESGSVGAGTGAAVGSILGPDRRQPGGIGIAQQALDDHTITALAVVNAFGVPVLAGDDPRAAWLESADASESFGQSTTLVAVITTLPCDHGALTRLCVAAHDAIARSIVPAHTIADGDVVFASTLNPGASASRDVLRLTIATELAVERAIRSISYSERPSTPS